MADEREYRELQGPRGAFSHVVEKIIPFNMWCLFLDFPVFLPRGMSKNTKVRASDSQLWGQLICLLYLSYENIDIDVKINV